MMRSLRSGDGERRNQKNSSCRNSRTSENLVAQGIKVIRKSN